MKKPLRESMPGTAAFIDEMREAFGESIINDAIRAGMQGQPTFWARENGREVGQRWSDEGDSSVCLADIDLKTYKPTPRRA